MKNKEVNDILFHFLSDVLYNTKHAEMNLDELPEDAQDLAKGLLYLKECVLELRTFSKGLADGHINTKPPAKDNPLTWDIRAMQGSITHMIWQAKQVTQGDFDQKVDFMGELSDVFNAMTLEIKKREERLVAEANVIAKQNTNLERAQDLLKRIISFVDEWIVIIGKNGETIYNNAETAEKIEISPYHLEAIRDKLCNLHVPSDETTSSFEIVFTPDEKYDSTYYFSVMMNEILWNNDTARIFIIRDISKEKEIESIAFVDSLTNTNNRAYGMQYLKEQLDAGEDFQIIFIDMDMLKFVNDTYGHKEGDTYIISTANALRKLPEPRTICRLGGDEFLVIANSYEYDYPALLNEITEELKSGCTQYERSFSYGISNTKEDGRNIKQLLLFADERMYQHKFARKKERKN